jgi:hypothetical protein
MPEPSADTPFEAERRTVAALKKTALMVLGTAMQSYGEKLADEQEVLSLASDIIMDVFLAESALVRAIIAGGLAGAPENRRHVEVHAAAAQVFVYDAAARVEIAARSALAAMTEGDTLRTLLAALRRVLKPSPVNTVALRRRVADAVIERNGYPF